MDFAIRGFLSRHFEPPDFQVITAIPVRNEAEHINACLDALSRQMDGYSRPLRTATVLLLNGCDDGTWAALQHRRCREDLCESWLAVDCVLPRTLQHAGGARRAALTTALSLVGAHTRLIATTDADSCVPPNWLSRQLDALDAGAQAVAGAADVDADEARHFPDDFRRRRELEDCYTRWLERIDAFLDPLAHDPWPRHRTPTGASLGFTPEVLRMLRPLPAPGLGEDRALVARCQALDVPIRFDAMLRVRTSGRLQGRAKGGMADTMAHRLVHPRAPCDVLLETFAHSVERSRIRAWLRAIHQQEALDGVDASKHLDLTPAQWRRLPLDGPFGRLWQELEQCSSRLQRIPLLPQQLPRQIELANHGWQSMRGQGLPQTANRAKLAWSQGVATT